MASSSYINWMTGLKGSGVLLDAYGKYSTGKQQGKIDNANAKIQDRLAVDALDRGASDAVKVGHSTDQAIGTQRAAIAQNNLSVSGTALDVLSDTAKFGAIDEMTIRNNAARQAWGYQTQAAVDRYSAKVSSREGTVAALGSLATGFSDTAGYYDKLKKA